MNATIIIY